MEELPVVLLLQFMEFAEVDQIFEDENEALLAGHFFGLLFDLEQILVEHFDRVGKQRAEVFLSFERRRQAHFFFFFGVAFVVLPQHFSHVDVLTSLLELFNNVGREGESIQYLDLIDFAVRHEKQIFLKGFDVFIRGLERFIHALLQFKQKPEVVHL